MPVINYADDTEFLNAMAQITDEALSRLHAEPDGLGGWNVHYDIADQAEVQAADPQVPAPPVSTTDADTEIENFIAYDFVTWFDNQIA